MDVTSRRISNDCLRQVLWVPGVQEANVYQQTVDYPDEFSNGYDVMLDNEKLVTVRWDQVKEGG